MIERVVSPGLYAPPQYAHASVVAAGTRLAFLAGSVPLDAEGELVGAGDVVAQTRQVLANLEEQLRDIGSSLEHVVRTEVYVVSTDSAELATSWGVVRDSGLSLGPHSSTLLGVAALGYPGQLVEITAVAAVPE